MARRNKSAAAEPTPEEPTVGSEETAAPSGEAAAAPPAAPEVIIGHLPDRTPVRLRLHEELASLPGWESDDEFEQLCRSVREVGILTPLLVQLTGEMDEQSGAEWAEVVDGRHRLAAASRSGLATRLPVTESEVPVRELMVRTLAERRHAPKGTRAYLIWPLIKPLVKGKGRPPKKLPTESVINDERDAETTATLETLAARWGFSVDLFDQARRLHTVFEERKDLRDEIEPGILSGDTGLGAALAGIAGSNSTKGQPRGDTDQLSLLTRGFKALKDRFDAAKWSKLPDADRKSAENGAVECVLTWPEEVRVRLKKAL